VNYMPSMSVKRFITSYPTLFGACIGLVLLLLVIAMETWAPSLGDAWDRHSTFVRDVWCTQALFVTSLVGLWPLRKKSAFWASLTAFFALHSLGIFLYRTNVHPLLLSQWAILISLEVFVIFLVIPRLTRLLSRRGL
jgi:hypothetical protein